MENICTIFKTTYTPKLSRLFTYFFPGMLWKKLIERKVCTDSLWRGLAERRGWITSLFKPKPGEQHPNHSFYRRLYPSIIKDIEAIESNWRCGKHNLQRINCRSENSKGVYCLQYDDTKIGTYIYKYKYICVWIFKKTREIDK